MSIKRRTMSLRLHGGSCPAWLFPKMKELTRQILRYIIEEYGEEEVIERVSDPLWFQGLSNVIGFDWHSSGTTTTTTAAIKEALKEEEEIYMAGGKGKTSLKTPEEIKKASERMGINSEELTEASRIIAKVDNTLIQDGYKLYHHTFIFTKKSYAVIQQGMNKTNKMARRYHWKNDMPFFKKRQKIVGVKGYYEKALILVGEKNEELRKVMVDISKDYALPKRHDIIKEIDLNKRDVEFFEKVKEISVSNFKELIMIKGMGEKRIRALALISHLIYGSSLEWENPVRYSFAHGGKDGIPFPVENEMYDKNIEFLKESVENSKISFNEKRRMLRKLYMLTSSNFKIKKF